MPKKDKHVYAFYKGEDILSIGTRKELSQNLELDMQTINYYLSKAYKKLCEERNHNHKKGFIEAVDLGIEGVDI